MRVRSLLVSALALTLVLAGCSDDGDAGGDDPDTSLIPPQSAESGSGGAGDGSTTTAETTAPETTGTTAPTTPTAYTAAARDAVNELKTAWETGDRARAATIAPGPVVDALFVVPPDGYTIQGCDTGEFETSTCNFRNRADEGFIIVTALRSDAGWQIDTIDVGSG